MIDPDNTEMRLKLPAHLADRIAEIAAAYDVPATAVTLYILEACANVTTVTRAAIMVRNHRLENASQALKNKRARDTARRKRKANE